MKRQSIFLLLSLAAMTAQAGQVPHLDPEMTGEEYRSIFRKLEHRQDFQKKLVSDPLNEILELGKRNLDWIEVINSHRDDQHKLQLTTPETTAAYPIEAPGYSNRSIIMKNLETLKTQMPKAMAEVIFGSGALPDTAPVDDQTFIENARTMNRVYEAASRWLLEEPYLDDYKQFAASDIRGYYFLDKEAGLKDKLDHWSSLDEQTRKKYSEWLTGECVNSMLSMNACQAQLAKAIQSRQVLAYHEKYAGTARQVYNDFFELQNPRPEVIWNYKNPDVMEMPFTLPERQDVQDWFKANVEDEYRMDNWSLKIGFNNNRNLAKVVFEPGATPHVNGLGGDTITMDANRPLQEYAVTWTIRHEFGHVLGFPDCYVEFYDEKNAVMINYQIDITNLMCSRRGHLQSRHFEQLKKHYYKG
jgi:hypothetical protein